ncbi:MAG: hypothetical protein RL328_2383 [Acidobacteriota bacterium]|jgi:DNA-binding NarL/FixJ family response regulator
MTLRVLVVESDPEELLFLEEVLSDLNGSQQWSQWTKLEPLFAATWKEAETLLAVERLDVILLDLNLADAQSADAFRHCQSAAPGVPVVLLVAHEDDLPAAEHLLRQGAQDVLLWSQVDCAPMARAIRNAIDRHRLLAATRATSMVDSLTGLLSRDAFLLLAERDRHIAESLHRRQLLVLAEPQTAPPDEQQRDLTLVDAAEQLRSIAGSTDLLARVGLMHLAISVLDSETESAEEIFARLRESADAHHLSLGAAVYDPHRPMDLEHLLERAHADLHPATAAG